MRILIILPYGSVGGMERLALSFYNQYKKQNYFVKAVKFIGLSNDIINFGIDEIVFSRVDYAGMTKINRIIFNFKIPYKLRILIKKHKITHSISFGDPTNFYSSITFTKEYKIGSIHALKSVEMSNNSKLSKLTKFGFDNTYKKFDKLVCISKAIKKDLINNLDYKSSNLKVIYNPHDITEIINRSNEALDTNENELFNNDVILFLGRLTTQKSPWHLIKSFSLVLNEKPDTKLIFIGDGDKNVMNYLTVLIDKLKINNNVVFLGRKSNPYKYLVKSNLLALSSHYEGTPNVIVEAICLNTPVVSSNCTNGIIELMTDQKNIEVENINVETESGIITPNFFKGVLGIPKEDSITEEEKLFAKALKRVLEDNKFKINLEKNRDNLLKKFDLENVANQYLLNEITD